MSVRFFTKDNATGYLPVTSYINIAFYGDTGDSSYEYRRDGHWQRPGIDLRDMAEWARHTDETGWREVRVDEFLSNFNYPLYIGMTESRAFSGERNAFFRINDPTSIHAPLIEHSGHPSTDSPYPVTFVQYRIERGEYRVWSRQEAMIALRTPGARLTLLANEPGADMTPYPSPAMLWPTDDRTRANGVRLYSETIANILVTNPEEMRILYSDLLPEPQSGPTINRALQSAKRRRLPLP